MAKLERGGSLHRKRWYLAVGMVLVLVLGIQAWGLRADLREDLLWFNDGNTGVPARSARGYPLTWPLVQIWSHSYNPNRHAWAAYLMVSTAWPAGEGWLEEQLRANPSERFPVVLTDAFLDRLHLRDPGVLQRTFELALASLNTSDIDGQFSAGFLRELETSSLQSQIRPRLVAEFQHSGPARTALLLRLVGPQEPDGPWPTQAPEKGVGAAVEYGRDPIYELMSKLPVAGPERVQFLRHLVHQGRGPHYLAACILLGEVDPHQRGLVEAVANADLRAFNDMDPLYMEEVCRWCPHSRLAQGCRAYGLIRGLPYFGNFESEADAKGHHTLAETELLWRAWLKQYWEHPGADDAAYELGRCLEHQGRAADAFWFYVDTLRHLPGDRDMAQPIYVRLLALLDTAASDAAVDEIAARRPVDALNVALQYARAVRAARRLDFGTALALTAGLNERHTLQSWDTMLVEPTENEVPGLFIEQRRRWMDLQHMVPLRTAQDRFKLGLAYAGDDAWKTCYLGLWQGNRVFYLDFNQAAEETSLGPVKEAYRQANASAVAIGLLHQVANDPQATPSEQERSLFLVCQLLTVVGNNYPEMEAMQPLPGFPAAKMGSVYDAPTWYDVEARLTADNLAARFPHGSCAWRALQLTHGSADRDRIEACMPSDTLGTDLRLLWPDVWHYIRSSLFSR